MNSVRLLPFDVADGPANMAADEVMLEAAVAGTASLRFYRWSIPTLSLGYFQPASVRQSDSSLAELPFVRRASGGATLVHHHELTYALALPGGFGWQPKGQSWICRMHDAIAVALATLAVTTRPVGCGEEQKLGDVLCFLHQTAGDLTVSGHKLVGSAQRKARGALLQHGAVLLARSTHTPSLPGLAELTGIEPRSHAVSAAVLDAIRSQTGWHFREGGWSDAERDRIRQVAAEKFGSQGWNEKR
jgi:lipoate-protein ligase A